MFLAAMMQLSLTTCGGGGEPAPAANDPAPASEPRIAAEDVIEKAMEEAEEFESFSVEAVEHYLKAYGMDLSELEPKWEWELKSKYSTYADDPSDGYGHAVVLYSSVGRELTDEEIDEAYERNTGKVISEVVTDVEAIPAILVKNHGVFTWGSTPEKAVEYAVTLEEVAKMALLTEQLNGETPRIKQHLLDKHYFRKHGKNAYYGQK